jgi:hypothetical protein
MKAFLNAAQEYCRDNMLFIGVMLLALITLYSFLDTEAAAAPLDYPEINQSYDFNVGISEEKFIHAYTVVKYE